ncbi:MAG: tetratricopeptide repeat protein [Candidatus Omnitrophica bacterium]|nr:tetratricopeptide repeat protein [Candidatus Omnitrophota bacterium]
MNDDLIHRVSALLGDSISSEKRESLLAELSHDPEAMRLLASMELPPAAEYSSLDLPFPILAQLRASAHGTHFRLDDSEGLIPDESDRKKWEIASRISKGRLRRCCSNWLNLTFRLPSLGGCLKVTLHDGGTRADVQVFPNHEPSSIPIYLETWSGDTLIHAHPITSELPPPSVEVDLSRVISIKAESDFAGLGIRLTPTEFDLTDWISLSLHQAQSGNFSEAAAIASQRIAAFPDFAGPLGKLRNSLEGLKGLVRVQDAILMPVPAFRSGVRVPSWSESAYRPFWNGLQACFPELRNVNDPVEQRNELEQIVQESNTELNSLLSSFQDALQGKPAPVNEVQRSADPRIEAGWAAFLGYHHYHQGDYQGAIKFFDQATPIAEDPFEISAGSFLATYLLTRDKDESQQERIWKDLYSEFFD